MPGSAKPPLSSRPIELRTNRISYVIAGGTLLPRLLGEEDQATTGNPPSQAWIASTVTSALGEGTEGLSCVAETGAFLKDLLDGDPGSFLGTEHSATWGSNPGYLIKLLNSRDRLLVQVHPDKARARAHFGSEFGKTEAWYVVAAESGALVHAGFKLGVTKELLREVILAEDSDRILGLLHAFPVVPGDLLFIPAGLPHALGKDSLILEIQEPTDITLRAERRRPSGEILPESYLHAGRGMEVLLDCFDYDGADFSATRARVFLAPGGRAEAGQERVLVSYDTTPCFAMSAITLASTTRLEKRNPRFAVAVVLSGSGLIVGD
ncbi:MAG: mannose-6-phosphate isomerase, partial [Spirochaetota bacterium]